MLQRGTGSRYIGEEAGKRRAALLCAAAEAFVPARKREYFYCFPSFSFFFFLPSRQTTTVPRIFCGAIDRYRGWDTPIRDSADNDGRRGR